MDSTRLVGAGVDWLVGEDVLPIEDAVCSIISNASKSIEMTMYSIWTGFEFVDRVWDCLEGAIKRGVHVYLIVNDFDGQQSQAAKRRVVALKKLGPDTVGIRSFKGGSGILHAKLLVVDEAYCIVSSSNQSDAGYARNHELGVLMEGRQSVVASKMFRRLFSSNSCVDVVAPS